MRVNEMLEKLVAVFECFCSVCLFAGSNCRFSVLVCSCPALFILSYGSFVRVFSFRLLLPVSTRKVYQQSSSILIDPRLVVHHNEVSFCSLFAPFKLISKIKKSFMKSKY
jgi:hypothetical protein